MSSKCLQSLRREKLPAEMKIGDAPFYLAVNNVKSGSGKPWFKKAPVGVNELNTCDLSRENHTNGYPFEPFKPFACRLSAVHERHEAVRTAVITRSKKICIRSNGSGYPFGKKCYPFERLPLAVQKKFASVRTARVIRSEKKVIRSNGCR